MLVFWSFVFLKSRLFSIDFISMGTIGRRHGLPKISKTNETNVGISNEK